MHEFNELHHLFSLSHIKIQGGKYNMETLPLIRLRVRDEYNTHASMQGARMQGCWLQVTRLQQCRVKGCRLQGARCGVQDAGHKGAGCRS